MRQIVQGNRGTNLSQRAAAMAAAAAAAGAMLVLHLRAQVSGSAAAAHSPLPQPWGFSMTSLQPYLTSHRKLRPKNWRLRNSTRIAASRLTAEAVLSWEDS